MTMSSKMCYKSLLPWFILDVPASLKWICSIFGSWAKKILIRWNLTQSLDFYQQLCHGIRYFDIRICYVKALDDFYLAHDICGHKIEVLLEQVLQFIKNHPKEVIILDCNHLFNFTTNLHHRLIAYLEKYFGEHLLGYDKKGADSTLNDIWNSKGRVIIIYHNSLIEQMHRNLWPGRSIFSPWPDTSDLKRLLGSLNERFTMLQPNSFNVFQCVLTPQPKDYLLHLCSSLKRYLVLSCNPIISGWLREVHRQQRKGVNVVMCDFVEIDVCVQETLRLNMLLDNN